MSAEPGQLPNAAAAGAPAVGAPMDRVDGRLKVTGGARYSAEIPVERVAHAVMVTSTIARGRVRSADTSAAERAPGVLAVLTPGNAPRLATPDKALKKPPSGRKLTALQDDRVYYNGQPVGLVVAETLEQATEAARLVRFTYDVEPAVLRIDQTPSVPPADTGGGDAGKDNRPSGRRGDVDAGLAAAAVRVDQTYTTPLEQHNPMEMHATIAVWERGAPAGSPPGDRLTLYDATQGVFGTRDTVARAFGLPKENVRVVSYFLGGGFGSKGSTWSHVVLAAMAARQLGRPVKLVLTRRQMFGPVGGRPETVQRLTLGAAADGALVAERHLSTANTSTLEDWLEPSAKTTRMLYACPNCDAEHALARLNLGTPTFMRAPGEASGTYALESAMDELAVALRMDPIALRLKNYAERDPQSGKPWSSKSLRECYARGAERFGWARRTPEPRSMTDGRWLVGYGMATATYPTHRSKADATARVLPDGRAWVRAGSQDIGTGTYTVMTQVAADALGIPAARVRFRLGDTRMPEAPIAAGSQTTASVGPAVRAACLALRDKLRALAAEQQAHGAPRGESYADVLRRAGLDAAEAQAEVAPPAAAQEQFTRYSFGAHFCEVRVAPDTNEVRVSRYVAAFDAGRVMNPRTARSQLEGGIVWGLGMALTEVTHYDPRLGNPVNHNLADYHVPVSADVPRLDAFFVDGDDPRALNPLGSKAVGEIATVGAAAAVANAVFHATGVRVRELPITPDRLA